MASGSRRVFNAFRTAPAIGTPKCASYISGVLGSITATVSPGANATPNQRGGKTPGPRRGIPPREAPPSVDHGESVRADIGAPGEEIKRRQRGKVGLVLVEREGSGADRARISH